MMLHESVDDNTTIKLFDHFTVYKQITDISLNFYLYIDILGTI